MTVFFCFCLFSFLDSMHAFPSNNLGGGGEAINVKFLKGFHCFSVPNPFFFLIGYVKGFFFTQILTKKRGGGVGFSDLIYIKKI